MKLKRVDLVLSEPSHAPGVSTTLPWPFSLGTEGTRGRLDLLEYLHLTVRKTIVGQVVSNSAGVTRASEDAGTVSAEEPLDDETAANDDSS